MAKKIKQGLSLFLTLMMVMTMLPTAVLASASDDEHDKWGNEKKAIDAIRNLAKDENSQLSQYRATADEKTPIILNSADVQGTTVTFADESERMPEVSEKSDEDAAPNGGVGNDSDKTSEDTNTSDKTSEDTNTSDKTSEDTNTNDKTSEETNTSDKTNEDTNTNDKTTEDTNSNDKANEGTSGMINTAPSSNESNNNVDTNATLVDGVSLSKSDAVVAEVNEALEKAGVDNLENAVWRMHYQQDDTDNVFFGYLTGETETASDHQSHYTALVLLHTQSDLYQGGSAFVGDDGVLMVADDQTLYDGKSFEDWADAVNLSGELKLYSGAEIQSGSFLDTFVIDQDLVDRNGQEFTLTGTGSNSIKIKADSTVYLNNVTVQDLESGVSAIDIAPGINAKIIVVGDCSLTGGGSNDKSQKDPGGCGIAVPTSSSVVIEGKDDSSSLTAIGMGQWAAGIGYFTKNDTGIGSGTVTIQNLGTLIAEGGYYDVDTSKDNGPEGGPAIGGGTSYSEYVGTKTISSVTLKNCGNVEARGGSKAAGIGSGFWNAVNVDIGNCDVKAVGGATAPAIGTARNTYVNDTIAGNLNTQVVSNIRISHSNIEAIGGHYGAGIGSGYSDQSVGDYTRKTSNGSQAEKQTFVDIAITGDSNVIATGGKLAAGIGGGYKNFGDNVTIDKGCTVYAYAGENGGNGQKIPSGIGSGADGSGLFSDVGGKVTIQKGAEVYAFSYGYEAVEPLASKWAVSRELEASDTTATVLQCRFLVEDTFQENDKNIYAEPIGVLAYQKDYHVIIFKGAETYQTVSVPKGYTCVAATVEPGAYQVTVDNKLQSSLKSIAYSAYSDGAKTGNPARAYGNGTHVDGTYARYGLEYAPYKDSDNVKIHYTFGNPSADFVVNAGVNSFDAVAYRPSVVPTQRTVTYQWDGDVPESGVTLPGSATVQTGDAYTPDSVYHKDYTLTGTHNGVEGTFSFSGWDQPTEFTVNADTVIYGTWTFTANPVAPKTGTLTGIVFHDKSRNSIYSATEDAVLSGVTVSLWKQDADDGGKLSWSDTGKTATTDANGKYRFADLEPGIYQVRLSGRPDGMNRDCSVMDDAQGNKVTSSSNGYETGALVVSADHETVANAGFYYYRSSSGGGGSNNGGGSSNGGGTPVTITDEEPPLGPELNTSDHYGYVIGYPADYQTGAATTDMSRWPVKPQGSITRAEVATIFFRMLTDESRTAFWSQENSYSDVQAGQWFNAAISTLSTADVIGGYPDGTFRPNDPITRAEFAALAVRFFEVNYDGENLFSDISGHWAQDYINKAGNAGLVSGYPDGTFLPQQDITRAEAVTLVNRTLGRTPDKDHFLDDMIQWPDNADTSAWYYADMQEATNSHDCTPVEATDTAKAYEAWTTMLETRDWAALEGAWAAANASSNPGEVIS